MKVYDSLYCGYLSDDLKSQLQKIYSHRKQLTIQFPRVQQQQGSSDCGVFAVAYAVDCALGLDPTAVKYDQSLMSLKHCLREKQFSRFPCGKRSCRAAHPDTVVIT